MEDTLQRPFTVHAGSQSPLPRKRQLPAAAAAAEGVGGDKAVGDAGQLASNVSEPDGGEFSAWTGISSDEFGQVGWLQLEVALMWRWNVERMGGERRRVAKGVVGGGNLVFVTPPWGWLGLLIVLVRICWNTIFVAGGNGKAD